MALIYPNHTTPPPAPSTHILSRVICVVSDLTQYVRKNGFLLS